LLLLVLALVLLVLAVLERKLLPGPTQPLKLLGSAVSRLCMMTVPSAAGKRGVADITHGGSIHTTNPPARAQPKV
jgi:hypothetical protein